MTPETTLLALRDECRQAAPAVADQMTRKNPFAKLLARLSSARRAFSSPKELRLRIHPKSEMQ
jgi:hypothetical protein